MRFLLSKLRIFLFFPIPYLSQPLFSTGENPAVLIRVKEENLELFQVRELRVRIAIVLRTDVLLSVTACKQHRAFDLALFDSFDRHLIVIDLACVGLKFTQVSFVVLTNSDETFFAGFSFLVFSCHIYRLLTLF